MTEHDEYVRGVTQRDPGFAAHVAAARAVLELSDAIVKRMEALQLDVNMVSAAIGLDPERIEAIIEGESPYFDEVALLCHVLHMEVRIGDRYSVPAIQMQDVHATDSAVLVP